MNTLRDRLQTGRLTETILDSLADAVSIQAPDFRILFQNTAHRNLVGNHTGDVCYRAYHRRASACEDCPLTLVFADGLEHAVRKRTHTPGGTRHIEILASPILDDKGTIIAGVEVARDITGRLEAEREIAESKQILEDITHGITESILLLSKDFKVLWANKAATKQTGYSEKEIIGNCCFKVTHNLDEPCEAPDDPCPVRELLKTGIPSCDEHIHYDRNRARHFVEVCAYPIRDDKGEVVRFVHISKDITERKLLEEERERIIGELRDALAEVKTLSGLLPICMHCKKIRDDKGYWNELEFYISEHSEAEFSHGLCKDCLNRYYPQFKKKSGDEFGT